MSDISKRIDPNFCIDPPSHGPIDANQTHLKWCTSLYVIAIYRHRVYAKENFHTWTVGTTEVKYRGTPTFDVVPPSPHTNSEPQIHYN